MLGSEASRPSGKFTTTPGRILVEINCGYG